MKRLATLAALLCGCGNGDATAPTPTVNSFDVTVVVTAQTQSNGCRWSWAATATDPLVLVSYRIIGTVSGQFRDTETVAFVQPLGPAFSIDWTISAGLWTDSAGVTVTNCSRVSAPSP